MNSRRLKVIQLSSSSLQWFVTQGPVSYTVIQGLPDDARFCGWLQVDAMNSIGTVWEHETFDIVPEGGQIPWMRVEFQVYGPGTKNKYLEDKT